MVVGSMVEMMVDLTTAEEDSTKAVDLTAILVLVDLIIMVDLIMVLVDLMITAAVFYFFDLCTNKIQYIYV